MEGTNKLSRALVWGTTLMFLIGGGAIEATATHGAVAASASSGATPGAPAVSADQGSEQVLGKRNARKKKKKKRKHGRRKGMSVYAGTTRKAAGSINTSSRAAVNAAYHRLYAPGMSVPTGWNGDDDRCVPGSTAWASLNATRNAVNFVRSLGGLGTVTFNSSLNQRSQRTALMMSAQNQLSHSPSAGWRCYSGTGAANAGKSNLALAYPRITSAGVVGLYMEDPGSSNLAVGHRRWLMNPFTTQMGSGSTDKANSITVIGPSSSRRPNPGFVAWPTAGWFPNTIEPNGRWSLSAGNRKVNFSRASVAVYRNGVRIPARKYGLHNGYAQPTMVFGIPASQTKSGIFTVVVRNIKTTGKRSFAHTYRVAMFTPSR